MPLGGLVLVARGGQGPLELWHPGRHLVALALDVGDPRGQAADLLVGALRGLIAGELELALEVANALERAVGAVGGLASRDDGVVALALDASRGLQVARRLGGSRARSRMGGLRLLGAGLRGGELLAAPRGERLGGGARVLERLRLRARALELGGHLRRLGLRDLQGGRVGVGLRAQRVELGQRALGGGSGALGPGARGRGLALARGPRRGGSALALGGGLLAVTLDLLARRGLLALEQLARFLARGLDRRIRAACRDLRVLRRGLARRLRADLGLLGLRARGLRLGLGGLGGRARLRPRLLDLERRGTGRPLGLGAQRGDLAVATGDGGVELLAGGALGGDALVEALACGGDLLAREASGLLGRGAGLLEERDAVGQLAGLALAAAHRGVGLDAQPRELVAGLAGGRLGGAARGALGLETRLERLHRLAALLGGALGGLAPAALLAQRAGVDRAVRRRRCLRGARRRLLRARQVDDAAARLERERQAPVLELRRGHGERRPPRRRVGSRERRRVVGPGQRGEAARAPAVVEQQHRRREPLAAFGPPAPRDAQQNGAGAGDDALEALDLEFGWGAHDARESRSASASRAADKTRFSSRLASSTRMRRGSAAASAS